MRHKQQATEEFCCEPARLSDGTCRSLVVTSPLRKAETVNCQADIMGFGWQIGSQSDVAFFLSRWGMPHMALGVTALLGD